jgi:hypothetical protein
MTVQPGMVGRKDDRKGRFGARVHVAGVYVCAQSIQDGFSTIYKHASLNSYRVSCR